MANSKISTNVDADKERVNDAPTLAPVDCTNRTGGWKINGKGNKRGGHLQIDVGGVSVFASAYGAVIIVIVIVIIAIIIVSLIIIIIGTCTVTTM